MDKSNEKTTENSSQLTTTKDQLNTTNELNENFNLTSDLLDANSDLNHPITSNLVSTPLINDSYNKQTKNVPQQILPLKDKPAKVSTDKTRKYIANEIFVYSKYFSIFNVTRANNQFHLKNDKFELIQTTFGRNFLAVSGRFRDSQKPLVESFKLNSLDANDYKILLNKHDKDLNLIIDYLIKYSTNKNTKELDIEQLNSNWITYFDKNPDLKEALIRVEKFKEENKFKLFTSSTELSTSSTESSTSLTESSKISTELLTQLDSNNNKRLNDEEEFSVKRIKIEPANINPNFESIKNNIIQTILTSTPKSFSSVALGIIESVCSLSKFCENNIENIKDEDIKDEDMKDEETDNLNKFDCELCDWKPNLNSSAPLRQLARHIENYHLVFKSSYLNEIEKNSIFYQFTFNSITSKDKFIKTIFNMYSTKENQILCSFYSNLINRFTAPLFHQFLAKYGNYTSATALLNDLDDDDIFCYGELATGDKHKIKDIIKYLIREENKFATDKLSFTYDRFICKSLAINNKPNLLNFTRALKYSGSAKLTEGKNDRLIDNRYNGQSLANDTLLRIVSYPNSTIKLSRFFESAKIKVFGLVSKETSNKMNGHHLNTILINPKTYVLIAIHLLVNTFEVYENLAGENFKQTIENIKQHNDKFASSINHGDENL